MSDKEQKQLDDFLAIIGQAYKEKRDNPMYADRDDDAVLWEDVILPIYCYINDPDNELKWTPAEVDAWVDLITEFMPPYKKARKPMDAV